MFPGLDLYYAGPAQPLTTASEELDDLDHDLSVRGVELCQRLLLVFVVFRRFFAACAGSHSGSTSVLVLYLRGDGC